MRSAFQSGQVALQDRSPSGTMASVRIAKPSDVGLADWMSQLRNWLDQHGIEPAGFNCHDAGLGTQIYEVSFPDQGQAHLFAAAFNKKTFDNKH